MDLYGRIVKIKKTKHNIFIIIRNYKNVQVVVKENLFYICKNLSLGDIIYCKVILDDNNNSKYKCEFESYKMMELKIVSKNIENYSINMDYDSLKKYSEAKFRVRNYLNNKDYLEVPIPILTDGEISSKASSFETKYSKTEKNLFMRKTMDIFLRMYSCSDFNKIYAIGPCFRNEYVTSKNIPEFEMLSIFTNYMDQKEAIDFAMMLIKIILNDEKLKYKYISEKEYKIGYEENLFYIIKYIKNEENCYSSIDDDGSVDEFKIRLNGVTIVHGVMEIKNIDEYLNKIYAQGKKKNYGELKRLEKCLNSGAPICYNLGISIIRLLSTFYRKKIADYNPFSFTRLNLKKENYE